jgi:hypothetical protein
MTIDLNLLPNRAKFRADKQILKKKVNKIVMTATGVWVFILLVVFGIWGWSKISLLAADKKRTKTENEYKALSETIVTSQQLKYRAKQVGEVLATRFEYSRAFNKMNNIFPKEMVKVTDLKFKDTSKFTVTGEADFGAKMDYVEKRVESINRGEEEGLTKAVLKEVKVSGGVWTFALEVGLK